MSLDGAIYVPGRRRLIGSSLVPRRRAERYELLVVLHNEEATPRFVLNE